MAHGLARVHGQPLEVRHDGLELLRRQVRHGLPDGDGRRDAHLRSGSFVSGKSVSVARVFSGTCAVFEAVSLVFTGLFRVFSAVRTVRWSCVGWSAKQMRFSSPRLEKPSWGALRIFYIRLARRLTSYCVAPGAIPSTTPDGWPQ